MTTRHGGKILISHRALLDVLDLVGGKIHSIDNDPCYLDKIGILVEHPDLPEIREGEQVLLVDITFRARDYDRTDPPHTSKVGRFLNRFFNF